MLMPETGDGSAAGAVENPAAILGNQPDAVAADGLGRPLTQASMQHAAVAGAHDIQPFSEKYCDIRHKAAFGFLEAPFRAHAAQHECDRRERLRDRDRAGQARKESRRGGRFEQQQVIGALGHRCGCRVGDRDQRRTGAMRRARGITRFAVE